MKDDKQLEDFFRNYKELEDENKDKLLQVGKKLLGVKKLVVSVDKSGEKTDLLKFNNETVV